MDFGVGVIVRFLGVGNIRGGGHIRRRGVKEEREKEVM